MRNGTIGLFAWVLFAAGQGQAANIHISGGFFSRTTTDLSFSLFSSDFLLSGTGVGGLSFGLCQPGLFRCIPGGPVGSDMISNDPTLITGTFTHGGQTIPIGSSLFTGLGFNFSILANLPPQGSPLPASLNVMLPFIMSGVYTPGTAGPPPQQLGDYVLDGQGWATINLVLGQDQIGPRYTLTSVRYDFAPEPGSVALLGIGLALVALARRRYAS